MIAGLLQILYWSCLFLQRKFYFKTKFYNLHLRVINRVVFNFKCKNCNVIQIWISPERVGVKTGCLAFIGISRPYFAITNKTRVQSSKIRNKFKS